MKKLSLLSIMLVLATSGYAEPERAVHGFVRHHETGATTTVKTSIASAATTAKTSIASSASELQAEAS